MPPGSFENLHCLRLNLRAFLTIYHPFSVPEDTGTQNLLKCVIYMPIHATKYVAWYSVTEIIYIFNSYAITSHTSIVTLY